MRKIIFLWIAPMAFLIGWYVLSFNDWHFGLYFFSRDVHDQVFTVYGNILGMEPDALRPLLLRALIIDNAFIAAVVAFRHRKTLVPWVRGKWQAATTPAADRVQPAE